MPPYTAFMWSTVVPGGWGFKSDLVAQKVGMHYMQHIGALHYGAALR